jgi:5-methylcytosine-specific restriction endonuclease McrA
MGKLRAFAPHKKWTDAEIEIVKEKYMHSPYDELIKLLPNRNISQIQNKANFLGIQRFKKPKQTKEERLESKRLYMEKKRLMNPSQVRDYQRFIRAKNPERYRKNLRDYYSKRFFWSKAMKLKGDGRATYKQIASLWKMQRGMCYLTNRKLDCSAHLDHIVPKARGGSDSVDNLRWLCAEVNLSKRDLLDDEFIKLCEDVISKRKVAWIGKRIQEVEDEQSN